MISNLSNHIFCTGLSYKESSISLRELLSLVEQEIFELLDTLSHKSCIREVLVLSTCNRFEIYGVFTEEKKKEKEIFPEIWEDVFRKRLFSESILKSLRDRIYSHKGIKAIEHSFKVFTSLDSLCIGETQITGQFKKSLYQAQKRGTAGPILKRFCHDAIVLNKKIRNQTLLGRNEKSIGQMAIELSLHLFSSIKNKSIVLIGAGKMIDLAYKHARCYDPKDITVVNRTKEKAQQIVKGHVRDSYAGLDELSDKILAADIILASTASPEFIIHSSLLRNLQKKRKNRPLFLIDIALPRDIDPECSKIEDVYLFDLDDIRKVIKIKNENQKSEIKRAEELISQKSQEFENWMTENIEVEPVLSDLGSYLKDICSREEERTLNKSLFKDISLSQKNALKKMLQSISQKILSDTAQSMKDKPHLPSHQKPKTQEHISGKQRRIS